jgi:peptidoglycan/xylan/chitin deacetylase (PgdA/CDA1 family)
MLAVTIAIAFLGSLADSTTNCVRSPGDSLRVPILVYHNVGPLDPGKPLPKGEFAVSPETFAAQMQYLREHGIAVVSLSTLVDALEGKCAAPIPRRAVVITFDDGRENQHRHAFPVLKRHGFAATFFPFTHAMNKNKRYLTWQQLEEMEGAGMTIGSHTHLHVRVDKVKDPQVLHKEISGSRQILKQKLAKGGDFFAYPFGALSQQGDSAVRAAGYRAGRGFGGGVWNGARDLWRLNSIPVTENMTSFKNAVDPAK